MWRQILKQSTNSQRMVGVRYYPKDITGANRDIPPWAKETLSGAGFTEREMGRKGWRNLLSNNEQKSIDFMNFSLDLNNFALTTHYFRESREKKRKEALLRNQTHDIMREKKLGCEIAAATFLVENGAAVKFFNRDEWVTLEGELKLPDTYAAEFIIEAIDMREFKIIRRGFVNLAMLEDLRSLKLCNSDTIDDWVLDFISGTFRSTLEYLDVSGCPNVTERGLSVLHRCLKLQKLYMIDTPNVEHRELLSILLEDALPNLQIVGVDYWDTEEARQLESASGLTEPETAVEQLNVNTEKA